MHPNLQMVLIVAEGLGELVEQTAFIGGSVTSLYATDAAASEIRPTTDVDCVIALASRGTYYELEDKLRGKGFRNNIGGGVICRWNYRGISVDIMPTDPDILGFSNPWYAYGMTNLIRYLLPNGATINLFPAVIFLATKLTAYQNRGEDPRYDSDFEDIIFLFNNRPDLVSEIRTAEHTVRIYIEYEISRLLDYGNLIEAIQSALGEDASRTSLIIEKFQMILA